MFLMVPFGLLHIFFSLNSFTRASSGVIVAHLIPTPFACSMHTTDVAGDIDTCEKSLCGVMQGKQDDTTHYRKTRAEVSMYVLCILACVRQL